MPKIILFCKDNREYSYLQMYMGLLWSLFLIGHVYLSGLCASLIKRRTQIFCLKSDRQKRFESSQKGVKIEFSIINFDFIQYLGLNTQIGCLGGE